MSEPYQVVARRFRPTTFDEVVGQDAVLRSLASALSSQRVPHAFLFSGSRGVGKTTVARILARALNCENGPTAQPCGECDRCRSILDGSNQDVVEIDAASHNLVDDIRELRDRVGFVSMGSRYKVYILDEVHMLTRSAFNAFLKTLEEPPANVVFVLATTELHKVPDTIRSRCQVLMFRQVAESDIASRLASICAAEGLTLAAEIVDDISAQSRGGMRDAETALERILPVAREQGDAFDLAAYRSLVHRVGIDRVTEVVAALLDGHGAEALRFADEAVAGGIDEREALGEVLDVLRALLVLAVDGGESDLVAYGGALRERLNTLACNTTVDRLDAMIQAGLIGRERIRRLDDRRLVLEVTLLRMVAAGQLPVLGDLLSAVESGVAPAATVAASPVALAAPLASAGDLLAALAAKLQTVKPMLVTTIRECTVTGPDEDTVTITMRTGKRMHRDRLASQPVQQLIREQLDQIVGRPVRLVVDLDGAKGPAPAGVSPPAESAEAAPKPVAKPGASVRRVVDKFDGRIVDGGD